MRKSLSVFLEQCQRIICWLSLPFHKYFKIFDQKMDGAVSFFLKHYGKSKFMVAMSKKAQVLGIEKLFHKSPKAFAYFFLFYLVRDVILYILIPIGIAFLTSGS
jgi:hypothetical protein